MRSERARRAFRALGLCALLLEALPLRAAFQDVGAGARAPGMGDAFTALADDVYAIHYNPAGLALLERPELGASYTRLLLGLTDSSDLSVTFLGYAHPLLNGREGVVGASWEQFTLDQSLYQEQAATLAYGRKLFTELGPGTLYGGLGVKRLARSFGFQPEASDAMNGASATGRPDPVLNGSNRVGAFDADAGLLYQLGDHYRLGLSLIHFPQPNVAFSPDDSDKLPLTTRLGLNYGSALSNLGAQYETLRSPIGTRDHSLALAAERWFLRLFVGDFGFRAALNVGNRSYRQVSTGLSYRTQRVEVDYGFAMPIGSISSTAGTHRLSLSIRFGAAREPDESLLMVLQAMRQLKKGVAPELYALGAGLTPAQKALLDEHVALARSLEARAKYEAAFERLSLALALSPSDSELLKGFGRLNWVAQHVKELPDYKSDPVQSSWHQGILAYAAGDAALAVDKVAHALSLAPDDKPLADFLSGLESATGVKRPQVRSAPAANVKVEAALAKASVALEEGRYDEAIALSREALAEDQLSAAAWEDMGTSYFAVGAYADSRAAWEKALELEKDPSRRALMSGYVKSIDAILSRQRPLAPAAAPPKPAAPERAARGSPQEVQRVYNAGVDFYTAGRLEKARDAFQEVLKMDPTYAPASKALSRVMEELSSR